MWKKLCTIVGAVGVVLLLMGVSSFAAAEKTVYDMDEVRVFEDGDSVDVTLLSLAMRGGQTVRCGLKPQQEVKKYPELKSSRPIYGSVTFGRVPGTADKGVQYYFVIDESEPAKEEPAKEKPAAEKAAEKKPVADQPAAQKAAVRRAAGRLIASRRVGSLPADPNASKRRYDRLYFDLNGDLDLTNDPVVMPMENPPTRLAGRGVAVFDYVSPQLADTAEPGSPAPKIVPVFRFSRPTMPYMTFMVPTVRKGQIKVGKESYTAVLAQIGVITGRFDSPTTGLMLLSDDSPNMTMGLLARPARLSALHWADGEYYQMSATPTGDKLTVAPYSGDCGVLTVSAGNRDGIDKLGIAGTVYMGTTMLPIGDTSYLSQAEKLAEHKVPVGDHTLLTLAVDLGKLQVSLSQNSYSKEKPHARLAKRPTGTFKIRKDEPLVIAFADKPLVLFTAPAQGQKVKPGDKVLLRAVIVDPDLDMAVRGVKDTTQVVRKRTVRISTDKTVEIPQYASLDPTVTITNAAGKQIAEGKMPFG